MWWKKQRRIFYWGWYSVSTTVTWTSKWFIFEKVEKLVANRHDKNEYVVHIRYSKQALNHGLVPKKVHGRIKFNQTSWLKSYIEMNTELKKKKKAKTDFEKTFLRLMNNSVFDKIIENVRKHRNIKLAAAEKRRNYWCQNKVIIAQSFPWKIC